MLLSSRTAVCRFLTGALEAVADKSGLGQAFLGLIVLPIAGNACEHITAVFVAVKDKMDLAIGVALGSSIQVCHTEMHRSIVCLLCMQGGTRGIRIQQVLRQYLCQRGFNVCMLRSAYL